MTVPLVNLDAVKVHLPIRAGVTDFDARLTVLIATATEQIEIATEREYDRREREEFFSTPDTVMHHYGLHGRSPTDSDRRVSPSRYTLATINIDPDTVEVFYDPTERWESPVQLGRDRYSLDAAHGYLTVRYPLQSSEAGLRVKYNGGFEPGGTPSTLNESAPLALRMACVTQTLFLHVRMDPMNIGRVAEKKEGEGGNTFSAQGGLTPEARALVARYRALKMGRS